MPEIQSAFLNHVIKYFVSGSISYNKTEQVKQLSCVIIKYQMLAILMTLHSSGVHSGALGFVGTIPNSCVRKDTFAGE